MMLLCGLPMHCPPKKSLEAHLLGGLRRIATSGLFGLDSQLSLVSREVGGGRNNSVCGADCTGDKLGVSAPTAYTCFGHGKCCIKYECNNEMGAAVRK